MAIPIKTVLTVSTKGFKLGMNAATKALGGLAAAAKIALASITVLSAGFVAIIARTSQSIDRFGKLAKTTGLSAEFMQKFAFAAEQAGVSSEQSSVALRRFARRLGEAKKGTGELLPELKRLGFSQEEITKMSPEQALFALADVMSKTEDETKNLTTSFKAFDSEGSELVVLLKQGSDAMNELFNEAESLGTVLSTTAIQGVEDFNDSFNALQTLLSGVAKQLTAALAPALEVVTDSLIDFISKGVDEFGSFESLAEAMAVGIVEAVMTIIQVFASLESSVISFINSTRNLARDLGFGTPTEEAKEFQGVLNVLNEELGKISSGKPIDRFSQKLALAIAGMEQLVNRSAEMGFELPGLDPDTLLEFENNITRILTDYNALLESGETNAFRQNQALKDAGDLLERNLEILREGLKQQVFSSDQLDFNYEKYRLILAILEKAKFAIMASTDEEEKKEPALEKQLNLYQKILEELNKIGDSTIIDENAIKRIKERLDPVKRLAKTLEDGLVGAVNKFEDTLTQGLLNGKADFTDFANFIKETLAKAFVQRFVTGPILAAFGLAKGGPANKGQPYIVGEEGPELFVPGASGTVIPNNQLMKGGTGGGVATTVNYNINAVDAPSFQQLVARDPEFIYNVSRAGARRTP